MPPRCVAGSVDRPPPSLPIGRAGAAQDHGSRHDPSLLTVAGDASLSHHGRTARHRGRHDRRRRLRGRGDRPRLTAASLQALVDSGEAKRGLRKLAVTHAERAALHRSPGSAGATTSIPSAPAWPRRPSSGRAKELGTQSLCWEVPHHVTDAARRRARRGHAAGRLRVTASTRATTTTPRALEALIALRPPRRRARPCEPRRRSSPRRVNAARDLQNRARQRPDAGRAGRARAGARGRRASRCSSRAGIEAAGMGAFAAVAQGSRRGAAADHDPLRAGRRRRPAARASSARP